MVGRRIVQFIPSFSEDAINDCSYVASLAIISRSYALSEFALVRRLVELKAITRVTPAARTGSSHGKMAPMPAV
jgi:hypothetical protein